MKDKWADQILLLACFFVQQCEKGLLPLLLPSHYQSSYAQLNVIPDSTYTLTEVRLLVLPRLVIILVLIGVLIKIIKWGIHASVSRRMQTCFSATMECVSVQKILRRSLGFRAITCSGFRLQRFRASRIQTARSSIPITCRAMVAKLLLGSSSRAKSLLIWLTEVIERDFVHLFLLGEIITQSPIFDWAGSTSFSVFGTASTPSESWGFVYFRSC